MLASTDEAAWCQNPEEQHHHHHHCRENLKLKDYSSGLITPILLVK
jgi:Fe2+ or Zn2+ uptake regulation protein